MKIQIDNITWDFKVGDESEMLGEAYVGIPYPMLKRFIKECGWDSDVKVPPHYFSEDLEYLWSDNDQIHECHNSDTQIVLMNWLHDKQRKYNLTYMGEDPFWIFHDNHHSQNDVYSYQVSNINSYIEKQRLLSGAQMSKDHGFLIKPQTVAGIINQWKARFEFYDGPSFEPIDESDFYKLMDPEEADQIHFYYE